MKQALIVWGGWDGHTPEQSADFVAGMLREHEFEVYLENTTEAFADPALMKLDLIVPIYTMSTIEREEVRNLCAAVEGGVGLAGFHGCMCDSFRNEVEYQFMTGGQWVAHPGDIIDYRYTGYDGGGAWRARTRWSCSPPTSPMSSGRRAHVIRTCPSSVSRNHAVS